MNKEPFDLIAWLRGSLDNAPGGASSKKISAFWVIVVLVTPLVGVWAWSCVESTDPERWKLLPSVLDALLLFAATALSIHGAERLIEKFKKPNSENEDNSNNNPGAAV